ncbi:MAG TPA: hypothetical protein VNL98_07310 [Gemmatimonadales bacterium]|nr:hypothetical protein [Gemmatimonadales bacterium]
MGYITEERAFILQFGRMFPAASVGHAETLLKCAAKLQRLNERACMGEPTKKEWRKRAEIVGMVDTLAVIIGADVRYNTDPRGYPVGLIAQDGRHVAVPGRGYSAAALRRMDR